MPANPTCGKGALLLSILDLAESRKREDEADEDLRCRVVDAVDRLSSQSRGVNSRFSAGEMRISGVDGGVGMGSEVEDERRCVDGDDVDSDG